MTMAIEFTPQPAPRLLTVDTLGSARDPKVWITFGPHPHKKPGERGIYVAFVGTPDPREGCQPWQPYEARVSYSGFDARWLTGLVAGATYYRTTKVVVGGW